MNTNMKELTLEEMELVTGGRKVPNLKPLKDSLVHWFLTEAVPEADRLKEAGAESCKSAASAVGNLCTAFVNWVKG